MSEQGWKPENLSTLDFPFLIYWLSILLIDRTVYDPIGLVSVSISYNVNLQLLQPFKDFSQVIQIFS